MNSSAVIVTDSRFHGKVHCHQANIFLCCKVVQVSVESLFGARPSVEHLNLHGVRTNAMALVVQVLVELSTSMPKNETVPRQQALEIAERQATGEFFFSESGTVFAEVSRVPLTGELLVGSYPQT